MSNLSNQFKSLIGTAMPKASEEAQFPLKIAFFAGAREALVVMQSAVLKSFLFGEKLDIEPLLALHNDIAAFTKEVETAAAKIAERPPSPPAAVQ